MTGLKLRPRTGGHCLRTRFKAQRKPALPFRPKKTTCTTEKKEECPVSAEKQHNGSPPLCRRLPTNTRQQNNHGAKTEQEKKNYCKRRKDAFSHDMTSHQIERRMDGRIGTFRQKRTRTPKAGVAFRTSNGRAREMRDLTAG